MPYALTNLVDSKEPSYRHVSDDYTPTSGEVVVADADFRVGWVWDAANQRLRPRTEAELKREAARHKREEFTTRTDRDFGTIFTSRVEFDYIVVRRLQGKTITLEQQQKADRVLALFDKLTRGNGTVDAYVSDTTKTAEDIIALSWETV